MVSINIPSSQSSLTLPARTFDYTLLTCATLTLFLFLLVLDAYEYVSVPGASDARDKIHTGVENLSGMEIMTKEERAAMTQEIRDAKLLVEKKHEELKGILDRMEREERDIEEIKSALSKASGVDASEIDVKKLDEIEGDLEEEEEEIIEPILEKELGVDKFCGDCIWNGAIPCSKRVSWMMKRYKISELEAKESVKGDCTKPEKRDRVLRGYAIF
ncbi:hypothetical protein ACHAXS_002284 [Conticribra weissflogii]